MASSNPTELNFATVFKDENDIIIVTMHDFVELDQYDVLNINIAITRKANRKPALKLLDARASWSMDKKAKEVAKKNDSANKTIARAIVVSNSLSAILLQFLDTFSKKDYPQQIFTNYDDAYSWLISFKTKE